MTLILEDKIIQNIAAKESVDIQQSSVTPFLSVLLPYSFGRMTMPLVFEQALTDNHEFKSNVIQFDFDRLNFVDPTAITVLSNLIQFLLKHNGKYEFVNFRKDTPGIRYLDECGFFLHYLGREILQHSGSRDTALRLELIPHDKSFEWINYKLGPWIERKVGRTNESFTEIKSCLGEIFNNIRDHSGEIVGSIFAEYYPKSKTVILTMSDFGKGIPTNVRKTFPELADDKAIEKAIEQGFTTKSTPMNQGMGLYYLSTNVVKHNGGELLINSLKGCIRCFPSNSSVKITSLKSHFSYPGTLLQMTFNTERLGALGVKEDFQW